MSAKRALITGITGQDGAGVIDRVGSLVETPGVNGGMSGREALLVLATLGRVSRRRVDRGCDAARLEPAHLRVNEVADLLVFEDPLERHLGRRAVDVRDR